MPRKKANKQTKQSSAPSTVPVIFAKCTGCQVSGELKACEFCQYPECTACIEKHRQADKLSQTQVMLRTKTDSLRQQTVLKYETLEQSIEAMITSLDLLKTTQDTFGRTRLTEFDAYEQKLERSQTINKQHLDDLKHLWIEFEKTTTTTTDDGEQKYHLMDQIEASLTKKHIQLHFQPTVSPPSLGSLDESLSDPITSNIDQTKEQTSSVQAPSSSSDSKIVNEKTTSNQKNTMKESAASQSKETNAQENNQHIVKNDPVLHCNKTTTSEMVEQNTSSKQTTAKSETTTSMYSQVQNISSDTITRKKNIANAMVIWLDSNNRHSDENVKNLIVLLRSIVNSITTYTDTDECVEFLKEIKDEQVFMIVSGSLSQQIIPIVENLTQLHSIYILCDQKAKYENETTQYKKLKGVFTQMESICDQLREDVRQSENDLIPISIVPSTSITNLDTLDQSFMYSQLLKEIILEAEYDANAKKELVDFCRQHYAGNNRQLQIINEFENSYDDPSPIWWYTRECFTYMMLNKALRTQDLEIIVKMAFFIQDLHRQLEQLQWQSTDHNSLIVYRGQGMLNAEFEKMTKNQGGLFSFNNFLSTSTKKEVSMNFARRARTNVDFTGILFQMKIDPTISSIPFASLDQISYYSTEKEILFSMHTVFRIGEIKQIEDRLWQIDLTLTSDTDQQLKDLTDYLRNEIGGGTGWQRMGILMFKMGEFDKATEIYKTLVDKAPHDNEAESAVSLATTYSNMALTYQTTGQYASALLFFKKTLEIKRKHYSSNDSSFAITYNNMGMVYNSMGNFAKAQLYHEKAIEIWQKSLPSDHPSLATGYNNLGAVYKSTGNYTMALAYGEKALETWKKSLPLDHPELATIFDNIGTLHQSMENYSAALSCVNKARDIRQKSLPPNHPELAKTYTNLGTLYQSLGKYSDALSYAKKALDIQEKSLSPNHPDLATTYNNIGVIHFSLDENSTAISYLQKALEIQQKSLPSDHVDLARTYNAIGTAQQSLGNFSIALSYYEKTLVIWQKNLSPNHAWMASIYNNMTTLYCSLGRKEEALMYAERGVAIARHAFGPDHIRTKAIEFFLNQLRR